jgi:hypothetical protein
MLLFPGGTIFPSRTVPCAPLLPRNGERARPCVDSRQKSVVRIVLDVRSDFAPPREFADEANAQRKSRLVYTQGGRIPAQFVARLRC